MVSRLFFNTNKKVNKNNLLVIVLVLNCLLSSCNRPKIKYHIINNDTIASYIHIGGKDKKDYVILDESFCNSFNASVEVLLTTTSTKRL